ncbi:MFS transporter [Luedemannella helvata]|uniref:MFS transporter n=1 Tax=Luedemannella helvata TaxID=349315 RepID=A0ABP4VWP5_9ACTN
MTDGSTLGPRTHTATLVAAVMATVGSLPVFLLSSQVVLMRADLDLTSAEQGIIVSTFFTTAALGTTVVSYVIRAAHLVAVPAIGVLASAAVCGLFAATTGFVLCLSFMAMAGVVHGALQMVGNMLLVSKVRTEGLGLAFGLKQSAGPAALLVGALAVPVVSTAIGWRGTFLVAAAGSALVAAGLRRALARMSSTIVADRPAVPVPSGAADPGETRRRAGSARQTVFAVGSGCASGAVNALAAFLPAWAFLSGYSVAAAALLTAVVTAGSLLMRIGLGVAADRGLVRPARTTAVAMVIGCVGLLLLARGDGTSVMVGAVLAVMVGWGWTGLALVASVRNRTELGGRTSRGVQTGAFVGGAVGPAGFGLLAGYGYPLAWWAAAGVMLASGLTVLFAERLPR